MNYCLRQFRLISIIWLCVCSASFAFAAFKQEDLTLVQIKLNNKLAFNSEVLVEEDRIYLPLRQIGEIAEETVNLDRNARSLFLTSRNGSLPVIVDGINGTIQVGDTQLDKTTNQLMWIQKDFAIKDDILIEKKLIEGFYDVKLNYDEENALITLQINRPLKSLKQERAFGDDSESNVIQPREQNLSIRSMQINMSSLGNAISTTGDNSTNPFNFGNQLNLNLVGDAYGGTYRIGPTFFQQNTNLGISGFQQSWGKVLNNNLGMLLGDSIVQLDPLNFPSSSVLGLRVGSPKELNLRAFEGISFEGGCAVNSEVLLNFNNQTVARQICKNGKYTFNNIPRLLGSNNNLYQVVQNNTDGTQITLREQLIPYMDGLIPAKEKRWNLFMGRPSFTNNLILNGKNDFSSQNINKLLGGANFQYGLTPKVNIQSSISYDHTLSEGENFQTLYGNLSSKPLFSDARYLSGGTASVGLLARPKENFGFSLFGALSQSSDLSPTKIFRAGIGRALYGSYDYRYKNFFNQGSFYYYSPEFYSPLSITSNRMGGSVSFGLSLKRQSIGGNFRIDDTNIDGGSFGGRLSVKNLLLTHNYNLSKTTSLSSSVNLSRSTNNLFDQNTFAGRTVLRQKLNSRLDATLSGGIYRQEDRKAKTAPFTVSDVTPGATLYLGKERQHQVSFGNTFFSDNTQSTYLQGRFRLKNALVYQPSITRFKSSQNDINWLISNGVFWEKQNGLRLGGEYIYGQLKPGSGIGTGQTSNHTLRLTMLCNVGFADKKPYFANTQNSGYVKGRVFIDLNKNGIMDGSDMPVNHAQVMFRDLPLKTDAEGNFLIRDIPQGIYEAYLDPVTLPMALVPNIQDLHFKVEPGRVTELKFTVLLSAGIVSDTVHIEDLNGKKLSAENIVVVATNSEGKEVAYTYVERNGMYTISELPPGEYTITIDRTDIENKNLNIKQPVQKVTIPPKIDEIVEISGINFEALQSAI